MNGIPTVLTIGETMGLVRAEPGGWETAAIARIGIGGADSNVAIGLARLGVRARWCGRVGNDSLGRRIVRELRGENIDVRPVIDESASTAVMLKENRTPASTQVHFYRRDSAGSRLNPADLDSALFEGVSILHITGITASISASAREAVGVAIERAQTAGAAVSFDVNHRDSLWRVGNPSAVYREIAAEADILFAGIDEALVLLGADAPDAAHPEAILDRLAALGPREVILKRGSEGSTALVDGVVNERSAHTITAVDTVGAGDAFVAGYLAARLSGESVADRLALASACGAFACLGHGDWESLPRRSDLALLNGEDPVVR